MSVGGGAEGGVAAVGGHPDFGMSGVSVPGSSGFGEQRGFGNNVGPIGLATNPSLQHDIAHVQLGYNVPGYTELDDNSKRAAMIDQMRHGMAVRSLTNAGLSPSLATNVMDAREFMSDQQERDYFSNEAAGNMMNANPHASLGDIAASIGSGNFTAASHQLNPANPNYAPSIEMINPVNITPTVSPVGSALLDNFGIDQKHATPQEDIDALMNDVLGLDLSQMDQDVLGLDRAMVSNYAGNPWGSSISNISHSDTEREYAERAAAERALYSQIAQQITQAAGQSTPSTGGGTTVAGPTGGSTGGPTTGGSTTYNPPTINDPRPKPKPEPRNPQPPRGRQDPKPEPRNPIDILVKTLLTPERQMRQLAPHARKALREGRNPDFSMLPDYQQDLVRGILNPPKPTPRMSDR